MKESLRAVNKLLSKSKSSKNKCLKVGGTETVNEKSISDVMDSFIWSIGKELAEKLDCVPNPLLTIEYEVKANKAKFSFKANHAKE